MNLVEAAEEGDVHQVRELLAAGVDIRFDEKDDALQWAATNGHTQIVELLLLAGANVHSLDDFALQYAAQNGHIQVVELLILADADVHAWHDLALQWAAANDHTQIVELLLLAGANITILSLDEQRRFQHLIPTYISIQEYLVLEILIINILELADRFIVEIVPDKKYVVLK